MAGQPGDRAAVARGMVLGQDETIDPLVVDDFRRSGLGHLLAVSGQNVVLLCALAMPLLTRTGLRARVAALILLVAAYVLVAGAGPSLQRAAAMAIAGLAALAVGRVRTRWYALLLAAAVTLAYDPRAAAEPGWQLSFAAVGGILLLAPPLRRRLGGPLARWPRARPDPRRHASATVFHDHEPGNPFAAELRAICSKLSPAHASGIVHDEEAQFQSYLTEVSESGKLEDEALEALQASHERVTEQYTEGGVVSLHMSDSERFVVEGTLEEDVTLEYLPSEARGIARAIRQSFLKGDKVFSNNPEDDTIDSYIEKALDRIYGNPKDKTARVNRTVRRVTTIEGQRSPVEYTLTKSVYPNGEEREYCREILDILIEGMQRDFILRSMNRSKVFRTFYNAIENATDVRSLVEIIQDAFQARLAKTINVKMFTTLNTIYAVKRARLESTAMRVTKEVAGQVRTFIPAVPVIELAKRIPTRELRKLATAMHTLPNQERERISRLICTNRSELYSAILDGLLKIVESASQGKRMYLRFAFYQDRQTGRPNEPHNMIHLLTAADTAIVWKRLIELSGVAQPLAA